MSLQLVAKTALADFLQSCVDFPLTALLALCQALCMTNSASTSRSATHSGHCQACGSLQKLPKGKLSLHGYTVAHGWFSGVCRGARELPFELSCNLVKTFIADATRRLVEVDAEVAALRIPATTDSCWVCTYEFTGRYGFNKYVWRYVDIKTTTHTMGDGHTYETYSYSAPGARSFDNVEHKLDSYGRSTTLELATKQNNRYADHREKEAKSLRRYISWQKERVATWKPAALFPVSHKDKLGFKVEEGQ